MKCPLTVFYSNSKSEIGPGCWSKADGVALKAKSVPVLGQKPMELHTFRMTKYNIRPAKTCE